MGKRKTGSKLVKKKVSPRPPAARAAASECNRLKEVVKLICLKQEKCGR